MASVIPYSPYTEELRPLPWRPQLGFPDQTSHMSNRPHCGCDEPGHSEERAGKQGEGEHEEVKVVAMTFL